MPKKRTNIDGRFLDSKFKISLLARPPLITGRGRTNTNESIGPAEVLLYLHGPIYPISDNENGFFLDSIRVVADNPIASKYPFHVPLMDKLKSHSYLKSTIEESDYEEFVRDLLVVADCVITRFRESLDSFLNVKCIRNYHSDDSLNFSDLHR